MPEDIEAWRERRRRELVAAHPHLELLLDDTDLPPLALQANDEKWQHLAELEADRAYEQALDEQLGGVEAAALGARLSVILLIPGPAYKRHQARLNVGQLRRGVRVLERELEAKRAKLADAESQAERLGIPPELVRAFIDTDWVGDVMLPVPAAPDTGSTVQSKEESE